MCQSLRAHGSNVTYAPAARAGGLDWNSESMRTLPVNERVRDNHGLAIPPGYRGPLKIIVGLYDPNTQQRIRTTRQRVLDLLGLLPGIDRERHALGNGLVAEVEGVLAALDDDPDLLRLLVGQFLAEGLPAQFVVIGGGVRPPEYFRTVKGRVLQLLNVVTDEESAIRNLVARRGLADHFSFLPFAYDTAKIYAALDIVRA